MRQETQWTTIFWEGWTALALCAAAVFWPGSAALGYPAVLWPGLALAAAVPVLWPARSASHLTKRKNQPRATSARISLKKKTALPLARAERKAI